MVKATIRFRFGKRVKLVLMVAYYSEPTVMDIRKPPPSTYTCCFRSRAGQAAANVLLLATRYLNEVIYGLADSRVTTTLNLFTSEKT